MLFWILMFNSALLFAQNGTEKLISREKLLGTWQKGSKSVGDNINQHFVFNRDGTFVLNLYSEGDDARNLIKLKGKFRLTKNELYFTILSKAYVNRDLEIGGMRMTYSLFDFSDHSKISEVKEINPKEMIDPAYVTVILSNHIKLNNQNYYKIK